MTAMEIPSRISQSIHMYQAKYFTDFTTPLERTENSILNMTGQPQSLCY